MHNGHIDNVLNKGSVYKTGENICQRSWKGMKQSMCVRISAYLDDRTSLIRIFNREGPNCQAAWRPLAYDC